MSTKNSRNVILTPLSSNPFCVKVFNFASSGLNNLFGILNKKKSNERQQIMLTLHF